MPFIVFRITAGKNQRCLEKSFRKFLPLPVRTFARKISTVWKTLFTDSEFQTGEIQPFSKFFSVHLLKVLGSGVLADFWKILFFHGAQIGNANHLMKNFRVKEKRTGFSACPHIKMRPFKTSANEKSIYYFGSFLKTIITSVPTSISLPIEISAPYKAQICFTIASPRPVPPVFLERDLSTR